MQIKALITATLFAAASAAHITQAYEPLALAKRDRPDTVVKRAQRTCETTIYTTETVTGACATVTRASPAPTPLAKRAAPDTLAKRVAPDTLVRRFSPACDVANTVIETTTSTVCTTATVDPKPSPPPPPPPPGSDLPLGGDYRGQPCTIDQYGNNMLYQFFIDVPDAAAYWQFKYHGSVTGEIGGGVGHIPEWFPDNRDLYAWHVTPIKDNSTAPRVAIARQWGCYAPGQVIGSGVQVGFISGKTPEGALFSLDFDGMTLNDKAPICHDGWTSCHNSWEFYTNDGKRVWYGVPNGRSVRMPGKYVAEHAKSGVMGLFTVTIEYPEGAALEDVYFSHAIVQ